jgi:hypothetical protein
MKKALVFIFFLGSLGTLYSLDSKFGVSLGVLGVNFDSNESNPDNVYLYGRIGSLTYKSWFGLGAAFSPMVFYYNNNEIISLTFANLSVNYNLLNNVSNSFILGPFVSINAIKYNQPDFLEFCSGLVFSWQTADLPNYYKNSIFNPELLLVETGFKYNKNDNFVFTTTVSIDLITMLYVIGYINSPGIYWEYSEVHK